ncbi:peptidase MA family metallohydrolase [Dendrosporobacter sp. 1207_IL3150]|uniref:peptidase MA family metallohydrolase n=1 Tax=Dendrosporobacter sp. 1207_IL3150 TaxID=3084054 RepID=UPI002FD9DF08
MKIINHSDVTMLTSLAVLLAVVFLFVQVPARPQMWLYPLVRQGAQAKLNYETRNMAEFETEHFIVKYTPADRDTVQMVAQAAEQAYKPVTKELGHDLKDKTIILIYPDKNELRKAFGWSNNESAMGVYWGGVIQLLSPKVWMKEGDSIEDFIHTGPMVHEFTHLVFDHVTSGNYPRWFTEGFAQYVEYQVNGYEWIIPTNTLDQKLYTMDQLSDDFDNLDNQALAYRQSLAAVRYIAEVHGDEKLKQVVSGLKKGQSIEKAISQTLGINFADFDAAWREWAAINMKN